jgi:ActR/RegA family two-component response regulator
MLCTQRQDQAGEGTPCLAVEPSAALLLVEDEVHSCSRLHRLLTPHGLAVTGASSTMTVGTVATASFAYAVIEMRLGDDSLELIQTLRERHARMRIVVVTDVDSFATAILAPRAGADDHLPKPLDEAGLVDALFDRRPALPPVPGRGPVCASVVGALRRAHAHPNLFVHPPPPCRSLPANG